jgi:hypothetical protein
LLHRYHQSSINVIHSFGGRFESFSAKADEPYIPEPIPDRPESSASHQRPLDVGPSLSGSSSTRQIVAKALNTLSDHARRFAGG